jgi:HD-like signal output (HDOD) protein
MAPSIFELSITPEGLAEPGYGVLAAFIPANAGLPPLVVAGCDPRHDPGKPIEGLAGPAFLHIHAMLGRPAGLRWVIVDNWGRFFEAVPEWSGAEDRVPLLEFKRFPHGIGVDAFTKELGASAEAALELLSAVIEGRAADMLPTSAREFLDAVASHGNLPAPGTLFETVNAAAVNGDVNAAVAAIQTDPVISASLVSYANAAAFASARRTASVSEAIQRLGMDRVRRVVFIAEMMARYKRGACPDFDYRAYWHNAVATGAAMRGLMEKYEIPERYADDAFMAGLLSGIGWLAIAETFPKLMSNYIAAIKDLNHVAKARTQREIFPCPVIQVAETYLSRFDFPESIHAAISGAPTADGWAWFDCLASAQRIGQALSPLECLAIPTNIPIPDPCRAEWQHWQRLLVSS